MEMTARKCCKRVEYKSFEQLLFFFVLFCFCIFFDKSGFFPFNIGLWLKPINNEIQMRFEICQNESLSCPSTLHYMGDVELLLEMNCGTTSRL